MKKALQFFWKLLRNNISLKILALLFAIVLWSYVLAATNPSRERVIHDVPVRPQNVEALKSQELAISDLSEALKSVDMRVKVSQDNIKLLNDQNVQAYVDLSKINSPGEKKLKVLYNIPNVQVLEVSPSEITLNVDKLVTKPIPVNVKTTGSVPSGYYANTPQISPNYVNIIGASSDVEKVTSALCNIDLSNLTEGYNKSVDVTLIDNAGKTVPSKLFTGNFPSVMASLTVLPEKTVPVDVSSIIGQDSLVPGFKLTGKTCNPSQVTIIGKKDVIDSITSIPLAPYSVSGMSADIVVPLGFAPPEGVTVINDAKAEVTVNIREITAQRKYTGVAIQQKDLAAGLDASIDVSSVDVTVIAGVSHVSKLDKSDIVPYIDLDGLEPGQYSLSVMFEIPRGFIADDFTASAATVTVTIKKK